MIAPAHWLVGVFVAVASLSLRSQGSLPAPERCTIAAMPSVPGFDYLLQLPLDFAADKAWPVVVLLDGTAATASAAAADGQLSAQRTEQLAGAVARCGFVVAWPGPGSSLADAGLAKLPVALRQRFRIAQGGLHLLARGDAVEVAFVLATNQAWEFQAVVAVSGRQSRPVGELVRLRGRRVLWIADALETEPKAGLARLQAAAVVARRVEPQATAALDAQLAALLLQLHAERELTGGLRDVASALDDFHDAASKGDENRYFALLPDDAVFLGTDGKERWTGAEFRAFALPYFQRDSAWTYVPVSRHVDTSAAGDFAWFDEVLDNEAYGECRGTGVMQRRGGTWIVRQYALTVPVPNELARGLVARIRDFAAGLPAAATTIVVVRHAEKAAGDDPGLTAVGMARADRLAQVLKDLPVQAVYASEFRRTQATVAPLCSARGLSQRIVKAAASKDLAQQIRRDVRSTVLVAMHSNTIQPFFEALSVKDRIEVADDEFDLLLVVTLTADGARLLRLRY